MSRRNAIIILVVGILMFVAVLAVFFISQGGSDQADTPPAEGEVVIGEDGLPIPVDENISSPENGTGESELDLPDFIDGGSSESSSVDSDKIEVVVSLQTIPRGWQLTEDELTTDLRYADTVGTNVITDVNEAIDLYVRTDVFQGQTLTKDLLVDDIRQIVNEDVGPSSLIPPGFVAQAVPMDRLSGVAYGLNEGDYVDVMVSFVLKEIDPQFQTLLENNITFYLRDEEGNPIIITIDPYGRFEELPTGEKTHIAPSENPRRPILVSMILQNAKVIQVGNWMPDGPISAATATPETIAAEDIPEDATPTPAAGVPDATATPEPPETLLLALLPQDQLLLKYAVEADADVDFALRGINDGQLYTIENIDFNYIKERFNIDIPANYDYTVEFIEVTPTPVPDNTEEETEQAPEGSEGSN